MSEASRFFALDQAVKVAGPGAPVSDILSVATEFVFFLTAPQDTPAQSAAGPEPEKAKPATRAAKAAAAIKSAKGEEAKAAATLAADADADADADAAGDVPSEQDVKDAVSLALAANKRAEVIALLKKYKAASASSVKEDDRVAFITAASALIPADDLAA